MWKHLKTYECIPSPSLAPLTYLVSNICIYRFECLASNILELFLMLFSLFFFSLSGETYDVSKELLLSGDNSLPRMSNELPLMSFCLIFFILF